MSSPNADAALIFGRCHCCGAGRPVRGSLPGPHPGRDGIRCPGSGRRPAYYCSAPEPDGPVPVPGGGRRG